MKTETRTSVSWVESNTHRTLTDDEARCVEVLCSIARPHNLHLIDGGWSSAEDHDPSPLESVPVPAVEFGGTFVVARLQGALATFDGSALTRLVLAAHDKAARVEIRPRLFQYHDTDVVLSEWDRERHEFVETDEHPAYPTACLEVLVSARKRDGSMYETHPTIEQAVAVNR